MKIVYRVAVIRDGLHECLCLQEDNGLGIEFLLSELKIPSSTIQQEQCQRGPLNEWLLV
jgi:hypothetical protein